MYWRPLVFRVGVRSVLACIQGGDDVQTGQTTGAPLASSLPAVLDTALPRVRECVEWILRHLDPSPGYRSCPDLALHSNNVR